MARIAIDRGGTFTDVICSRKGQDDIVFKVSTSFQTGLTSSSCLSILRITAMHPEKGELDTRPSLTVGFDVC